MIAPPALHPGELVALIDELEVRGLPVPAEALRGRDLIATLRTERAWSVVHPEYLLALTPEELVAHVQHVTLIRDHEDSVKNVAGHFAGDAARLTRAAVRANLDPILQALRPVFDAAGVKVYEAVEAGITPGMTAADAILLNDAAVVAWRGLPDHLNALEDIAALRIRLVDVLDAEPLADRWSDEPRPYGCCFTPERRWAGSVSETEWDRWLRLSTDAPVRLMSTEETAANAQRLRELAR